MKNKKLVLMKAKVPEAQDLIIAGGPCEELKKSVRLGQACHGFRSH